MDDREKIKKKCLARKNRNPVGRPKGGDLVSKAFNDAMERGDLSGAMDKILEVANNPDHKNWPAAAKMVVERVAHVSNYERNSGAEKPTININIGTVGTPIEINGEVVNTDVDTAPVTTEPNDE